MSPASWRGRLTAFGDGVRLAPPAPATALSTLQASLGVPLPEELRSLLAESDGLSDRYGARVVWPAADIAGQNAAFRTKRDFRRLYMPFEALLFFGETGNGDQFFYRILDGEIRDPDIYLWDHENDSRTWRAAGLEPFLLSILREVTE